MHIAGKNRLQFEMSCLEDRITSENPVRVIDAFIDVIDLEKLGFVSVVPEFIAVESQERGYTRQQSARGKCMMRIRAGTVEPVFGNLINYYGLRKINVKGKTGAHKVMLMSAIAFNLEKLMKFITRKR